MKFSFKYRFILSFLIIEVFFLALIVFVNFRTVSTLSQSSIDEKIETSTRLFGEIVKTPMVAYDFGTIDNQCENFVAIKNVIAVRLFDEQGKLISQAQKDPKIGFEHFQKVQNLYESDGRTFALKHTSVVIDGQKIGELDIVFELTDSLNTIDYNRSITFLIILLEVIISSLIAYLIGHRLTSALESLTLSAEQISQNEKALIPDYSDRSDELAILSRTLNLMQERIDERNEKLKISAERFERTALELQLLLNSITEGVFGTDLKGNCTFVNVSFLQILGYSDEHEVLGKNIHALIHHSHADGSSYPSSECKMFQVFSHQQTVHVDDEVFWTKTGEMIPVEYWFNPIIENGAITGAIATFVDISVRKEMENNIIKAKEAAEASAKAKSEFLAAMSHEIRTPMNGVLGMLHILANSELNETQKKYTNVAQNSAASLLGLINDILDFSKIDAGKMDIEPIEFNLKYRLMQIMESMELKAKEKGIPLFLDMGELDDSMIVTDPGRLQQIIVNLLGNAIKFTHEGYIKLKVSLDKIDTNHGRLHIHVIDTGIGIAPEKIDSLFDPFTQADGSTTRQYGGTGLGLAIVKKLSKLLGGSVSATSILGKGSTFSVDVEVGISQSPVKNVNDDEPSENEEVIWPSGKRLLVVDDDLVNRMVAEELLSTMGIQADTAESGREALEKLKGAQEESNRYTLVFMDCQMPEMDGFQTCDAIRSGKGGEANKTIPVIALTANAMDGDREKCIIAGMDDYLSKPIDYNELKKLMRKWLL